MEYQKITNLLGNIPGKVPNCVTKKWIEVHDQSCNADDRYKPNKQIRYKVSMLQYMITMMCILFLKELILLRSK